MKKTIIIIAIVVVAVLGIGFYALQNEEAEQPINEPQVSEPALEPEIETPIENEPTQEVETETEITETTPEVEPETEVETTPEVEPIPEITPEPEVETTPEIEPTPEVTQEPVLQTAQPEPDVPAPPDRGDQDDIIIPGDPSKPLTDPLYGGDDIPPPPSREDSGSNIAKPGDGNATTPLYGGSSDTQSEPDNGGILLDDLINQGGSNIRPPDDPDLGNDLTGSDKPIQ